MIFTHFPAPYGDNAAARRIRKLPALSHPLPPPFPAKTLFWVESVDRRAAVGAWAVMAPRARVVVACAGLLLLGAVVGVVLMAPQLQAPAAAGSSSETMQPPRHATPCPFHLAGVDQLHQWPPRRRRSARRPRSSRPWDGLLAGVAWGAYLACPFATVGAALYGAGCHAGLAAAAPFAVCGMAGCVTAYVTTRSR